MGRSRPAQKSTNQYIANSMDSMRAVLPNIPVRAPAPYKADSSRAVPTKNTLYNPLFPLSLQPKHLYYSFLNRNNPYNLGLLLSWLVVFAPCWLARAIVVFLQHL